MIFANIMVENKKGIKNKLLQKYRLVVLSSDSFEEKGSIGFTGLKFGLFFLFLVFFFLSLSFVFITYTPISGYLPGKTSSEVQQALIRLSLKSDSLEDVLKNQSLYFENIENLITGNIGAPISDNVISVSEGKETDFDFNISKEDSLLRLAVEREDKGSFFISSESKNEYLTFFSPVSGIITDDYDVKAKHFGVDLVAKDKSRIRSVLDGVVILSTWTAETGYVLAVQHENNFVSIYKHNSFLIKSVGDYVAAGDHLAVIGNSGELTSGPHLHFELWHNERAVDPKNYIDF